MGKFIIRRLLTAIPTLLAISFVIFAILDLAPNDPTGNLPLTIPPQVRAQIRASLGLDEPFVVRYLYWLRQFLVYEPLNILESSLGVEIGNSANRPRIISFNTRSPVVVLIAERVPQTLWVVGLSFLISILIAIPIGVISAYKQYSIFDQAGTFISLLGYSLPTFFTGLLVIYVFSVKLRWFPSIYDTTLKVVDWASFVRQMKQSVMPVAVLAFFQAAQLSRFTRAAMLDNLNLDYVRTARSKGLTERIVVLGHVLRNSLIPVVTLIALGIPGIFGGAIITEQIFRVNGLGQLLILIVLFNIVADVAYGILDPRIRYD